MLVSPSVRWSLLAFPHSQAVFALLLLPQMLWLAFLITAHAYLHKIWVAAYLGLSVIKRADSRVHSRANTRLQNRPDEANCISIKLHSLFRMFL